MGVIFHQLLLSFNTSAQEGIESLMISGQQKYPAICFAIGLGTSPLIPVNYFVRLFVFSLGIVVIEAVII